jgi:hypothetical protein
METLINGYHLFQLSAREPSETVSVSVLTNDLGEGYEDSVLFGSDTGLRKFSMDFPVLNSSVTCELDGVELSPFEYLWELFLRQKTEGTPFVIQSALNNQYYLCKFIDNNLTEKGLYKKLTRMLFTSSAMFQQIRRPGVSVFDMTRTNPRVWLKAEEFDGDFDDGESLDGTTWDDLATEDGNDLFGINGAILKKNQQNGKSVVRLDGVDDFLICNEPMTIYQALMVIKIREDTWSDNGGVLTAGTANAFLIGNGSGTKFFDIGLSGFQYKLNGIAYDQSNQQSPMNEFGIVYVHKSDGISFDSIQIGKDRDFAGRFAALDVGEVILWTTPQRASVIKESVEYLNSTWAIWQQ